MSIGTIVFLHLVPGPADIHACSVHNIDPNNHHDLSLTSWHLPVHWEIWLEDSIVQRQVGPDRSLPQPRMIQVGPDVVKEIFGSHSRARTRSLVWTLSRIWMEIASDGRMFQRQHVHYEGVSEALSTLLACKARVWNAIQSLALVPGNSEKRNESQ
ncbi:hypothetical protein AC579_4606 [Pseudocercospora musae]|uniref:Uncharacterized protein n=1 Tax=Pseudocercospora musae TaxID=113226 RepID=A0A139GUK6_9PEZI|nr:hypothetical protein AC579_4606 [Pseudocercospora musae]